MEYLVKTGGEAREVKGKTYVVNARSKQEARQKARHLFCEEYSVLDERAIYTSSFDRTKRAIIACVLMLIPVVISLWRTRWFVSDVDIEGIVIQPNGFSCTVSAFIYLAFVVKAKGIERTIGSIIDIALALSCILLMAVLINCVLIHKTFTIQIDFHVIPDFEKAIVVDTRFIVLLGIVFSWLGIKLASTICMAITCVFAVTNILGLSDAMGLIGVVFSLSAIFGFLFYLSIEPAVYEALPSYMESIRKGISHIKVDYIGAKQSAQTIGMDITNTIKKEDKKEIETLNNK